MASMTMTVAVAVVMAVAKVPVTMMPMSSSYGITMSIPQMDMLVHDRLPITVTKVTEI